MPFPKPVAVGENNFINNGIGPVYSFPIRIGGYIVAGIGLFITASLGWHIILGIAMVVLGLYFATSRTGILVDVENRAVKRYTSRFMIRFGQWREYPTYRNIAVIRKNKRKRAFYKEANDDGESAFRYEIYLLSRSHRGKVLLEVSFTREDAEFRAQRYCEMFPAELVEYAPPNRGKKKTRHHHRERKSHGDEKQEQ